MPEYSFRIQVLRAIRVLMTNAYGVSIKRAVSDLTGREVFYGKLYATLGDLEKQGLISSSQGESTEIRGGRRKKYYKLEEPGIRALEESERQGQVKGEDKGDFPLIMLDELGIHGMPR